MRLVIDTTVLVAELLRERGRQMMLHPALDLFLAEAAWGEIEYEIPRRLATLGRHGRVDARQAATLQAALFGLLDTRVTVMPDMTYGSLEEVARARIPRDPHDWPTVALAVFLSGAIWTTDCDFLGCGMPTWTTDTLVAHLHSA